MKKNYLPVAAMLVQSVLLLLSACTTATPEPTPEPTATALPPTSTQVPPSQTPTVTSTQTATNTASPTVTSTQHPPTKTATATPLPSDTPTLMPTETPTLAANQSPALPSASKGSPSMYMILVGSGGGNCADSAIPVSTGLEAKGSVETDVTTALKQLFSIKSEYVGGLLNPLYRSNLRVNKVKFNSNNGLIVVELTGTYKPTGDPCDNTRVKAQVWSTVRQYKQVKATDILLNGIPFGDRVSNDK